MKYNSQIIIISKDETKKKKTQVNMGQLAKHMIQVMKLR